MNTEYHDQVSQPIIFKCGTTLVSPVTPAVDRPQRWRMRSGVAVAILMMIAGFSGGEGVTLNPPRASASAGASAEPQWTGRAAHRAGRATRSVLIARMSRRDAHGMPPVGSAQVEAEGAALLTSWVNSLTNCN